MAKVIPWDSLVAIYSKGLSNNSGRKSINIGIVGKPMGRPPKEKLN